MATATHLILAVIAAFVLQLWAGDGGRRPAGLAAIHYRAHTVPTAKIRDEGRHILSIHPAVPPIVCLIR